MDLNNLYWMDTTGDGFGNVGVGDSNLDGRYDHAALDMDGDGYVEGYAWDTNGDGAFDAVSLDSTRDGYLDSHGWDTTGDGQVDHVSGYATDGQVVPVPAGTQTVTIGGPAAEGSQTVTIGGPTGGDSVEATLAGLLPTAGPYETVLIDRLIRGQGIAASIWSAPDNVIVHRY